VIARRPRQRYFDREFHETLWRRFQGLGRTTKRFVLALLVVGAAYAFSGGSKIMLWGTMAIAALLLFALYEPKRRPVDDWLPSDDDLRALDRLEEDELAAPSLNGHDEFPQLGYEEALGELLALVGREVTAIVAAVAEGWGTATLHGTLKRARDVGREDDEVLFFSVGKDGGFFMPRERFRRAEPIKLGGQDGVALYIGETVVWVVDEQTSRDRSAGYERRRKRP
jgi:hypothetical protein